jgi:hypothetical protein
METFGQPIWLKETPTRTKYAEKATQSEAGHLFEMIADLTDDDGVIAEFDDLLGFLG